jgi:NAD(P)-dependent dehydrogenase (short-subunit alcohol dehydrogenase family)
MAKAVTRHLVDRGAPGSIINVASIAGIVASPLQGIYAMTKAAVISMTKTLAAELASSGIRVNAIAPGYVDTKFAAAVIKNKDIFDIERARVPQQRAAEPDEIGGAALYLASDAASFVTGHTLVIDGGRSIT